MRRGTVFFKCWSCNTHTHTHTSPLVSQSAFKYIYIYIYIPLNYSWSLFWIYQCETHLKLYIDIYNKGIYQSASPNTLSSTKVRSDSRTYLDNSSDRLLWHLKNSGSVNGIGTHDLCDAAGVMLYQIKYEATQLREGQFLLGSCVPVKGLDKWTKCTYNWSSGYNWKGEVILKLIFKFQWMPIRYTSN